MNFLEQAAHTRLVFLQIHHLARQAGFLGGVGNEVIAAGLLNGTDRGAGAISVQAALQGADNARVSSSVTAENSIDAFA